MRALPNDFGRKSAIFTVRNKKVPRAALYPIVDLPITVNKDVEITYTGSSCAPTTTSWYSPRCWSTRRHRASE